MDSAQSYSGPTMLFCTFGMGLLALYHCILEVIFFLILLRVTTKIALILLETLNLSLRTMLELLRILEALERQEAFVL